MVSCLWNSDTKWQKYYIYFILNNNYKEIGQCFLLQSSLEGSLVSITGREFSFNVFNIFSNRSVLFSSYPLFFSSDSSYPFRTLDIIPVSYTHLWPTVGSSASALDPHPVADVHHPARPRPGIPPYLSLIHI